MCDHHTIDDQNVNGFLTNLFTPKNDQKLLSKDKKKINMRFYILNANYSYKKTPVQEMLFFYPQL